MANFHTHIGVSSALGVAYGSVGYLVYDVERPAAILSAGLCGVAGMLPDLDSDRGVPIRESMAFLAAVVPMLLLDRFRQLGWTQETIVLVTGILYFLIRFGGTTFIRKYTVHRGMWHSLPAATIAGLVTYLLCACPDINMRLYKTGAVVAGFLSHLVIDEIWSIDVRGFRVKKTFGTAFKFFGKSAWGNISVYGKLALLLVLVFYDPPLEELHQAHLQPVEQPVEQAAEQPAEQAANEFYDEYGQPLYEEYLR